MEVSRADEIIAEARSWIGTPYHHKARVKGVGADCIGFIYGVYSQFISGLPAIPNDYPKDWFAHKEQNLLKDALDKVCVPIGIPLPASIVCFRVGLSWGHAGIVLNDRQMVNVYKVCQVSPFSHRQRFLFAPKELLRGN